MPVQTKHWVFTLNNWTDADDDNLKALGPQVEYLVYGYETGDSGTRHLQGYIIFSRVKRFAEAQALLPRGSHLECKRGTPFQAASYCKKDGLFQEFGPPPTEPARRITATDRFKDWVLSEYETLHRVPTAREIAQAFPTLYLRSKSNLLDLARHLCPQPVLIAAAELRDWQTQLALTLHLDPR